MYIDSHIKNGLNFYEDQEVCIHLAHAIPLSSSPSLMLIGY